MSLLKFLRRDYRLLRNNALFDRDYYLAANPDVRATGKDPLLHFLKSGAAEGRNPNPLFSTNYYWEQNPDVRASGMNPLAHFIRNGAAEFRRPNELFDVGFYVRMYPDVIEAGLNPLEHFLKYGIAEGRWPNELFSTVYYLHTYQDVARSGKNPLEHYLVNGAREGRRPNHYFDSKFYMDAYPDVKASGVNPLTHYLRQGAKEFRAPSTVFSTLYYWTAYPDIRDSEFTPLGHFLMYGEKEKRRTNQASEWNPIGFVKPLSELDLPKGNKVIVVIPVYGGYEQTRDCITSALKAKNNCNHEFLIIYDCGPDDKLRDYIKTLEGTDRVHIQFNPQNLGFVKTANIGMQFDPKSDVVLLNSDTLVSDYWLDRMYLQAHSKDNIASVTPFSNNATICSYPTIAGVSSLPNGESLEFINSICVEMNAGQNMNIPTAVGFCMYITRKCMNEIGFFDEENFGKGYGEENDFCMRATAKGYLHLFAFDTFVFHAGNVSFGSSSDARKAEAGATIRRLYPHYESIVQEHVRADMAKPARDMITAGRHRASAKQVCLIVTHALGGGTEKHINDLVEHLRDEMDFIFLRPVNENDYRSWVRLTTSNEEDHFSEDFDGANDFDRLLSALKCFGVSRVHIHHTLGFQLRLQKLIRVLGLPFDFTVHDYFTVCPFVTMTDVKGRYCGEPNEAECNRCISKRNAIDPVDIIDWRESSRWLFEEAERVIVPSRDVAERVTNYYPEAKVIEVSHDTLTGGLKAKDIEVPELKPDRPLRILMIGAMVTHKGSHVVRETMDLARERQSRVRFQLIGAWDNTEPAPRGLQETGAYEESEFEILLDEASPHVVWFPGQCPETFSYTLSLALEKGLPIVAPNIGAFRHRVKNRHWTWLLDVNSEPAKIVEFFENLRTKHFVNKEPFVVSNRPTHRKAEAKEDFYSGRYLEPLPPRHLIDLRRKGRVTGSIVCEYNEIRGRVVPTACGYIRLALPYTQTLMDIRMHSFLLDSDLIPYYITDFLVTQRLALGDLVKVNSNLSHLKKHGIKMIYDLDDDLLAIDSSHPEYSHYSKLLPSVARQALEADLVTVSTEVLVHSMKVFNPKVEVVPNSHDDRVWEDKKLTEETPEKIRILYMGTPTHTEDLLLIKEPLERIIEDYKDKVEVVIIGGTNETTLLPKFKFLKIPEAFAFSYPVFVKWLSEQGPFHIGLSPLVENKFNVGKSALKFMDYTALGLVTICSDVSAYADAVHHDENGLKIPNDQKNWEGAIRSLLDNPARLKRLRDRAKRDYLTHHLFNNDDSLPAQAIQNVIRTIEPRAQQQKPEFILDSMLWDRDHKRDPKLPALVEAAFSPGLKFKVGSEDGLSADNLVSSINFERMLRASVEENKRDLERHPQNEEKIDVKTLVIENLFLENENPIQVFKDLYNSTSKDDFVIFKNDLDAQEVLGLSEITDLDHLVMDYRLGPAVSRLSHYGQWLRQQKKGGSPKTVEALLLAYESREVKYYHRVTRALIPEFFKYCRFIGLKFEIKAHLVSKSTDLFVLQKDQSRIENLKIEGGLKETPMMLSEV